VRTTNTRNGGMIQSLTGGVVLNRPLARLQIASEGQPHRRSRGVAPCLGAAFGATPSMTACMLGVVACQACWPSRQRVGALCETGGWRGRGGMSPVDRGGKRLATGSQARSMRRLSAANTRHAGVAEDGDPRRWRRESDVSQRGNAPSTMTETAARRVAPWHARQVMDARLDHRGATYPGHGSTACLVVDQAGLVWLKISAASTPLKWLRLGVYWPTRSRHCLQPEELL
jgi:hypothetical protein